MSLLLVILSGGQQTDEQKRGQEASLEDTERNRIREEEARPQIKLRLAERSDDSDLSGTNSVSKREIGEKSLEHRTLVLTVYRV